MIEQLKAELAAAEAELRAHMGSLEYAFAMGSSADGGSGHPKHRETRERTRIGLGWAKSQSFTTGQCPVMKYHHGLMQMILNDKAQIAKAVNATVISLDEAPKGYKDFDQGAAKKFVLKPHGLIKT